MTPLNLGAFSIPIKNVYEHTNLVAQIFVQLRFIPIRATINTEKQMIEYVGISKEFDEIKPGEVAPAYDIKVDQVKGKKKLLIKVKKTAKKDLVRATPGQVQKINKLH